MLLSVHTKRRLALLEQGWLGRGQLLFLVILWTFVIGNFGRALLGFNERRLLTEGVITVNAVFATMIVLLAPRTRAEEEPAITGDLRRLVLAGSCRDAAGRCVRAAAGNALRACCLWRRSRKSCGAQRADHPLRAARRLETASAREREGPPLTLGLTVRDG